MHEASEDWVYALDQPGSAGPATIRHGVFFVAILLALTASIIVFGAKELQPFPPFTIFHAGFVFVVDAITASLLFAQFAYRRLPSYCILAGAFLYSALIMVPFLLSFPGALKPGEEVIGGPQSSIWVWHLWHAIFPAIVTLSLAVQARGADRPVSEERVLPYIAITAAVALVLVLLVAFAVTVLHDSLPMLIEDGRKPHTPNFYWIGGITAAITTAALALAARLARRRTVLHIWLALLLLAILTDEAVSLGAYPRYSVGWYFGRIEWMLAVSVLLVVFLTDIIRLYHRLAGATRDLFDANRKLSALVEEKDMLLAELRESEERLRQVDERKDVFMATLAHELRNPLAPLRNAAHVLAQDPDPAVIEWAGGVIDRQVTHMARLLEDLLDISRIKRARLELRRAPVSLQEILEAAYEQSRPLLQAAKQELRFDVPAAPIYLDGDKTRLAQVFANLLNNAARYTPYPGTVTVVAREESGEVVVRVRDTGIGIEPDALGSVFDAFYQERPLVRSGNGGVGIGLQLVKGLVELHGGSVTAQSEGAGKGSEFTVRLPIVTGRSAAARPPEIAAGVNPVERPLRVLVVDDNRDNTDSMCTLLKIFGHDVGVAYDARGALALGAEFRPEAVLLDIGLPDITGYECARLIRETDWGRDALLIAMTGWGTTEDKRRAAEAGFEEHLTKPVDIERLEKILAERTVALA